VREEEEDINFLFTEFILFKPGKYSKWREMSGKEQWHLKYSKTCVLEGA
jgi:hypothetical protein